MTASRRFGPRLGARPGPWSAARWRRAGHRVFTDLRLAPRQRRAALTGLAGLLALLTTYLLLPYATLWRLDRALVEGEGPAAIAGLVDVDAVRDELGRRLNKDQHSLIGELSAPFIDWLQRRLRSPEGHQLALVITLPWLYEQMQARVKPGGRLWSAVSHAWFDTPTRFRVHLDGTDLPPLRLLLQPGAQGWRVVVVYY